MNFTTRFYAFRTAHQLRLGLFFTALFIRLPFFFRDYIDRDESTFILMGQSVAEGHLPYAHLWDLKPPLLFYIFGAIQWLFPYSFIAIRAFGVAVVFGSALLLLKLARQNGLKNGPLIALLYIILSSELGSLQGVMSEHVAVFFMLAGILFFQQFKNWWYFFAGVAFGCALLCKLSYAYGAAVAIVYLIWVNRKSPVAPLAVKTSALAGGILLPLIVLALPFYIAQSLPLFIASVFLAPLKYAQGQTYSLWQRVAGTWWVMLLSAVIIFGAIKKSDRQNKGFAILISGLLAAIVYTFFRSGSVNGHYLVQAYPFMLLLLFGIVWQPEIKLKLWPSLAFVLLISAESLVEYHRVLISYMQSGTPYYRQSFKVVDELKSRRLDQEKIFFTDYHIGYWMLRQHPLTKSTTHPSNLVRPYLFPYFGNNNTSVQELQYILQTARPGVVVGSAEKLAYFSADGEENRLYQNTLRQDFTLIYWNAAQKIFIWKRRQP